MNYTVRNLIIAAVLGLIGIVLVTSYIRGQEREINRGSDIVKVLVAKKDIPAGTQVSALDDGGYVEVAEVRREDAAPRALPSLKAVGKLSVKVPVYSGEQLTGFKFETKSGLNPTEQIKGTQRIIAMPFASYGAIAGIVKPGDHVDILASQKVDKETQTWVVARDVVILQTPESLLPPGDETAPAAPKKGDEFGIFMLEVSDKVAQNLQWSYAHANDDKLQMLMRPSDGDQETTLETQTSAPPVS